MRQKASKAVEFLIPAAPSPFLFLHSTHNSQITTDLFLTPFSRLHQHPAVRCQQSASAYSLRFTCPIDGCICYSSSLLASSLLHIECLITKTSVTHSDYYLGPPSPHYRRAKDLHTSVSICFVPHPADWFNSGLIKLRCHIQDYFHLSSEIDTSHILCRPATALPVCIAIKTEQLHNVPRRCRAIESLCGCGYRQKRKGTFRPATSVSSNGRDINKYAVDFGHSHLPTIIEQNRLSVMSY